MDSAAAFAHAFVGYDEFCCGPCPLSPGSDKVRNKQHLQAPTNVYANTHHVQVRACVSASIPSHGCSPLMPKTLHGSQSLAFPQPPLWAALQPAGRRAPHRRLRQHHCEAQVPEGRHRGLGPGSPTKPAPAAILRAGRSAVPGCGHSHGRCPAVPLHSAHCPFFSSLPKKTLSCCAEHVGCASDEVVQNMGCVGVGGSLVCTLRADRLMQLHLQAPISIHAKHQLAYPVAVNWAGLRAASLLASWLHLLIVWQEQVQGAWLLLLRVPWLMRRLWQV